MSAGKTVGVIVLALLLVTTVGAANVATAGERTVLNAEFVDQSLEEEDGYSHVRDLTLDAVDDQVAQARPAQSDQLPEAIQNTLNVSAVVDDAVTESYVRNQSRANLFRLYEFLHGERDTLTLQIDLVPLKDSLAAGVSEQVEDIDIATLVDEYAPATADSPLEISGERVRMMRSNESSYQAVRENFRDEMRTVLFERLRQDDPALLLQLIGDDPTQYSSDAERRQAVDENEQEIMTELRALTQEGADNRINDRFEQGIQERVTQAKDRVRQDTREATGEFSENVTAAAIDAQIAVIDGLATDTSYGEFTNRIDAAEAQLADEAGRLATQQIEQGVPDTISPTEGMSPQDREQLTVLSERVQQVDTLSVVLPVVALVLVGLVYLLTRSVATTALTAGLSVGLVGAVTFVGTALAGDAVGDAARSQITGENAEGIRDLVVGLVDQVLGVLGTQSLLLVVVGVILLLVWLADRRGYLAELTGGKAAGTGAAAGAGGRQADPEPSESTQAHAETEQNTSQSPAQEPPASGGDEGVEPLDVGGDSDPLAGGDDQR